jgi:nucleoside phosphorylase
MKSGMESFKSKPRVVNRGILCENRMKAILLYSAGKPPYAWIPMLLVVAALLEELKTGMSLCHAQKKIPHRNLSMWEANRNDKTIGFLRAGVGPRHSAANLEEALKIVEASNILLVGYAGALDPDLRLGDLVAVSRALAFSLAVDNPTWENVQLNGTFELARGEALARSASALGLTAYTGDVLTSSYVLGDPVHKSLLYKKFHALIVDMETAALARVAASKEVPLSCIRVISDEASDSFLAPFSHDPSNNMAVRAGKLLNKGMLRTYREWKANTRIAQKSLTRFLLDYL